MIEAYRAVRSWRIHTTAGAVTLTSMYNNAQTWTPGVAKVAECHCAKRNRAPWRTRGTAHTCGIYAWRDVDEKDPIPPVSWYVSPLFVHGEVYLWGDVRCHERGYRASHALIAGIYVSDAMRGSVRRQAEMAAEQYKVPIIQRDHITLAGRTTW